MKKIFIISSFVLIFSSGLLVYKAQAADIISNGFTSAGDTFNKVATPNKSTYTLLAPLPRIDGVQEDASCVNGNTLKCISFNTFIQYAFKFAIALAVFLAIAMIIFNGFKWMLSESSFTKVSEAKTGITNAVLGLLGALACYLILLTIDPRLVQINTSIPVITATGCSVDPKTNQIVCSSTTTFQNQLGIDLKEMNATNIATLTDLQNKTDAAKKRIAEINTIMSQPGYVPNEELENELYDLQQTVATNNSQTTQVLASGHAGNNFNVIISAFRSGKTVSANGVFDQNTLNTVNTARAKINAAYDAALKDPGVANDPAAIQKLQFEKDFYTAPYKGQIDTEQAFYSKLWEYDNTPSKSGTAILQPQIDVALADYTQQLNLLNGNTTTITDDNLKKIAADPVLLAEYKTALGDRIASIKMSEAKKAKTP